MKPSNRLINLLSLQLASLSLALSMASAVFVVTPRLIKPLPQKIALPTDGHIDPSRSELFLGGQLEGKATQKNNADSDSK